MKIIVNKLATLSVTLTAAGFMTLQGQVLEYHFTGTVEGNHPDVSFSAGELDYSDGVIKFGDQVSGALWVYPARGSLILNGALPQRNLIYSGGLQDVDVRINGVPFIASEGRNSMDIGTFDNASTRQDGVAYPLGEEIADAVVFVSFGGIRRVGISDEQFSFALNFTDTTGEALSFAGYPAAIELEHYDLAKGFIRPSRPDLFNADFGAMFQIDSFELVGVHERKVIAEGPKSQTVEAGDSIRLTMLETRGNKSVERQWSLNGVDLPGETLPWLTLNNLQPRESGTYRVTVWDNLGTTNVASARIVVEGVRHRLSPLSLTGWNADVIAAPGEDLSQQDRFDRDASFWFATEFQDQSDGFPRSGGFTSAVNANVRYQLQPFEEKNVLWLTDSRDMDSSVESSPSSAVGHLTLQQPTKLTSLALIAASTGGGGDDRASLILHFADGSESEMIEFNAGDWWTLPERAAGAAIAGLGRLIQNSGELPEHDSPSGHGFGLYETELDLVALGLADKTISSIEFQRAASAGTTGVFAVSGQSAELHQGFHVEWPREGDRELFEVAISPDGPWIPVNDEGQTNANRRIAMAESARLPRFSRSRLRSVDLDLYAHYDFSRGGRDRVGEGMKIELGSNEEFIDGTLFIPRSIPDPVTGPFAITASVPRLNYTRYTLVIDFFPLEVDPEGKQNIVAGGISNLWLQLYADRGRLTILLDGGKVVEVFEDAVVQPDEWHRVICAVDTRTGVVDVMLDGRQLPSLDLGERYRYEVTGTTAPVSARALNFSGTRETESFVGYLDNLMLYRNGLSPDEMNQLHGALSPAPLAIDFGRSELLGDAFSVGMSVAWESNLEGFELQRAGTPTGPWSAVVPLEGQFNERFLFPLQLDGEQGIYRLRKPF